MIVYDLEMVPHLKLKGLDKQLQRTRVFIEGKRQCSDCKRKISFDEPWEWDHIQGGNSGRCDCLHNAQILCPQCHIERHGRYPRFGEGRKQAIEDFNKVNQ